MANFSKLCLPAELRLMTYEYLYPPLKTYVSDCKGLFLCSRGTSQEFEAESLVKWERFLEKFKASFGKKLLSHPQIDPPRTLKDLSTTIVRIPLSICRQTLAITDYTARRELEFLFTPLFECFLEKIRFEFFEDEENYEGPHRAPDPCYVVSLILRCAGFWPWALFLREGQDDFRYVLKKGTLSEADEIMELTETLGANINVKVIEFQWDNLLQRTPYLIDPDEKGLFDYSGVRFRNNQQAVTQQALTRQDSNSSESSLYGPD